MAYIRRSRIFRRHPNRIILREETGGFKGTSLNHILFGEEDRTFRLVRRGPQWGSEPSPREPLEPSEPSEPSEPGEPDEPDEPDEPELGSDHPETVELSQETEIPVPSNRHVRFDDEGEPIEKMEPITDVDIESGENDDDEHVGRPATFDSSESEGVVDSEVKLLSQVPKPKAVDLGPALGFSSSPEVLATRRRGEPSETIYDLQRQKFQRDIDNYYTDTSRHTESDADYGRPADNATNISDFGSSESGEKIFGSVVKFSQVPIPKSVERVPALGANYSSEVLATRRRGEPSRDNYYTDTGHHSESDAVSDSEAGSHADRASTTTTDLGSSDPETEMVTCHADNASTTTTDLGSSESGEEIVGSEVQLLSQVHKPKAVDMGPALGFSSSPQFERDDNNSEGIISDSSQGENTSILRRAGLSCTFGLLPSSQQRVKNKDDGYGHLFHPQASSTPRISKTSEVLAKKTPPVSSGASSTQQMSGITDDGDGGGGDDDYDDYDEDDFGGDFDDDSQDKTWTMSKQDKEDVRQDELDEIYVTTEDQVEEAAPLRKAPGRPYGYTAASTSHDGGGGGGGGGGSGDDGDDGDEVVSSHGDSDADADVVPPKSKKYKKHTRQKKQRKPTKRNQHACPLEDCDAKVVYLKRHLDQAHTPEDRIKALDILNCAKSAHLDGKGGPRSYKSRGLLKCSVTDCKSVTTRLDLHLVKMHGFVKGGPRYISALETAEPGVKHPVDTSVLPWGEVQDSYAAAMQDRAHGIQRTPSSVASSKSQVMHFLPILTKEALLALRTIGYKDGRIDRELANKSLKASSMEQYIRSLTDFIIYLQKPPQKGFRVRLDISIDELGGLVQILQGIRESLHRDINIQKVEEVSTTKGELPVTATHLGGFLAECESEIDRLISKPRLKSHDRTQLRDRLMCSLMVSNGKRTGDLSGLLKEAVDEMEPNGQEREFKIPDHKESKSGQLCYLKVSDKILRSLKEYSDRIWLGVGTASKFLFLTSHGNLMSSSTSSKAINNTWRRFAKSHPEWDLPRNLPGSLQRKVCITTQRELGASRKEQVHLAKHMGHNVRTADTYYDKSSQCKGRTAAISRVRNHYMQSYESNQLEIALENSDNDRSDPSSESSESSDDAAQPSRQKKRRTSKK